MVHAIRYCLRGIRRSQLRRNYYGFNQGRRLDRRALKFAIACSLRNTGSAPINAPTFTNPAHWRHRAQEARWLAQQLEDPEAKAAKLEMAGKYDRLAARATEWMSKTEKIPQFLMSGDDDGQEEVINTRQPN